MGSRLERQIGAGPGLTAQVNIDVSRIAKSIEKMGGDLPAAVKIAAQITLEEIVADLQQNKLSGSPAPISRGEFPRGGHYLAVRTGRGRGSMRYQIEEQPGKITGSFGSAAGLPGSPDRYMKPHEEGFSGNVRIREHTRLTPSGRRAHVRPHYRFVDIPARRYIRAALLEGKPKLHRNVIGVLEALFGRISGSVPFAAGPST